MAILGLTTTRFSCYSVVRFHKGCLVNVSIPEKSVSIFFSEVSTNCASSIEDVEEDKKKKRKKKARSQNNPKLNYKCIGYWRENHGHPIFGVSVNHHLSDSDPVVFATVGYNREVLN